MKKIFKIVVFMGVLFSFANVAVAGGVADADVIGLVEQTAAAIAEDAPATLGGINNGEHPYKNKDNPAFYVFVYDTEVNMAAHPKNNLVGRNYKGKPDVRGKAFRDEIVSGALTDGSGWVDYSYQKPGEKGIHAKTTYFKLAKGSDNKDYVICCGKYKD